MGSCLSVSQSYAQSYWEMTPYKIAVELAIDPKLPPGSQLSKDLPPAIVERADNFVGAAWQLSITLARGERRERIITAMDQLSTSDSGNPPDGGDKVVVLALTAAPDGYHVQAREFDLRTQTWGGVANQIVQDRRLIPDAAFSVLWQAFAPVAQIDVDAERNVVLRPRAGGLPFRDTTLQMVHVGDLFQPVIRKVDRKGKSSSTSIQPMPWTYLVVEKLVGMQAFCKTHSGLRQSLSSRRRGQSEQLAIAVRPLRSSTRLTVLGRGKPPKPLPGYDVYAQVPGQKAVDLIGRTDPNGQIDIPVADAPVRILYIKGGGMLLARLPMVPGLDRTATAEVADDDVRLALEGYLSAVSDNVIDVVARREILMARARSRMTSGKLDEAEKFFDELRRLPTREQIALAILEEKNRNASSDPAVQAKLNKLADETQKMLRRFLDPKPIDALRTELNQATKNPPVAAEAAPPAGA